MGRSGLNALLNLTNLRQYITELPPDNYEREFNFAHVANMMIGLEKAYGPKGGQSLALRTGRKMFPPGLKQFGPLAGASDLAFKVLPLNAKLKIGLPIVARVFTQFSDQISWVEDNGEYYMYYIEHCSMCWGRQTNQPACHLAVGILQAGLVWVSGGSEFRVEQLECKAMGALHCSFKIDKEPLK